jgi:hypothetical protein
MKYVAATLVAVLCTGLLASTAWASQATGKIAVLRVGSPDPKMPDRVSVYLDPPNTQSSCSVTGWFAFDGATSTALGALRTQTLVAAYEAGRPVTIVGTGTCDQFGVEQIYYVDVQH